MRHPYFKGVVRHGNLIQFVSNTLGKKHIACLPKAIGRVVFMTEKSLTYMHKIHTFTYTEIQIDINSLSHTCTHYLSAHNSNIATRNIK